MRVTTVEPLDDHRLRVSFNDGIVRDVTARCAVQPLRDPEHFRMVRVDEEARTILWPNGLDPAPELLHDRTVAATGTARLAS